MRAGRQRWIRPLALASTAHILAGISPAAAQEAPPPAPAPATADADAPVPMVTEGGTQTYTPADFARYAPRTALDMLQRVPGFAIQNAVVERGLGQATGNVLLNGQRISNKTDDIVTQLGRVPAANVIRIEIVDAATLDIPGLSGQVANIIARAGRISGQFSYNPEFRTNYSDPNLLRFNVSVSGTRGPVEFTLGLENQASRSAAGGPTLIFNRDGSLREGREDAWRSNYDQPRASARFVFDGPGSSVGNLNMIYREFWEDYREQGLRTRPGQQPFDRDVTILNEGHNYEIGGDFEFAFGPGRLKLIGLQRASHAVRTEDLLTAYRDGRPNEGQLTIRDSWDVERIARAEYRWAGGAGDWQLSGEAAFNSLDTGTDTGSLRPDGTLTLAPLAGSIARVEEARYEGILSYSRPLAPNLTIQVAAGAEYSQLSQVGAGGVTREFVRPKGQVTAAWAPDPDTTVNLRLQRRVGQISFLDFVSSVNLRDGTGTAGNVNLVPPQTWEAEVEVARRLGPWGSVASRIYYHLVEDVIDFIPIGATGEGIGNIDQARRFGIDSRATINFDPMGWRGARLDARWHFQTTEVEDPLTRILRPISGERQHYVEANLRYDIPGSDWALGTGASHTNNAFSYRLTEFGYQIEGPVWLSAYVEHKNVLGLTVRATVGNTLDARSTWDRYVFAGRRTDLLDYYERRDRLIGPIFSLQIRGRF